jgi:transposase-like protein
MIDFPIVELLDEEECARWLEQRLHPDGLHCPGCHADQRRVAQRHRFWTAYRCKACDQYYTLLTGTIFEKTRQLPSKLVLLLRGIANGGPTSGAGTEPMNRTVR